MYPGVGRNHALYIEHQWSRRGSITHGSKEIIMKTKKRIAALMAAVSCAAVFGVGVPSAYAWYNMGERNDSSMTGLWKFNWTHSYASCQARATACTARAWQDGQYAAEIALTRNEIADAEKYGKEQLTNDGAEIY
ncbi:hypothetical protein BSAE_1904 [Bifidobacterium pullorum subsp. saeculare DSM 6531 = LMG 14934]|nr:hypothetical protein BSAE_1904 [Bifidobacterium pullorum subsp. saeculare DSM 6531 = LMG 14934]